MEGHPSGCRVLIAPPGHHPPDLPRERLGGRSKTKAEATKELLAGWNTGLQALKPAIAHPDVDRDLVLYGEKFDKQRDLAPIPEEDLPAGVPAWMRSLEAWAVRKGQTADDKRATVAVTIPRPHRNWPKARA